MNKNVDQQLIDDFVQVSSTSELSSLSELEDEPINPHPCQKKTVRENFQWTPVSVCLAWDGVGTYVDDLQARNDNIRIVKDKIDRISKLTSEVISTFKCGGFRRYGCTYALKFVKKQTSDLCLTFEHGEHFHSTPDLKKSGIPQHVKHMIHSGLQICSKPSKIYREMKKKVSKDIYQTISRKQVAQALVYMRKKNGSALVQNTIGYLHEWLESHELTIHSEMHTVGVLPGWIATGPINLEDSSCNIHFVMTTKRLLSKLVEQANCSFGQLLALDGTYSLLDVGYPVLKFGTMDAKHSYHEVGVCVSRHEDEAAFKVSDELEFQSEEADKFPVTTNVTNTRANWCNAQLWLKNVKKYIRDSTCNSAKVLYVPSTAFLAMNHAPTLQELRNAIYHSKNKQV
jgi:hypothetical protein